MSPESETVQIRAPAKINLFLQVIGKRPDGYHEIVTLMCCVGLYDTVWLTFAGRATRVLCKHPDVPADRTNSAFVAAHRFDRQLRKRTGSGLDPIEIRLDKQIPVAAGLGGGSSDAAAVLVGLNRHYGAPFSLPELLAMAVGIGADVPFFISRKPAIATGIGERLEPYDRLDPYKVVLVYPGFGVSTAAVYKGLNLGLTRCKIKLNDTLFKARAFDVANYGCNDLESVTFARYPDLMAIKDRMLNLGAKQALMSGSGPTIFGLFADTAMAHKACEALAQSNAFKVFLADMLL